MLKNTLKENINIEFNLIYLRLNLQEMQLAYSK